MLLDMLALTLVLLLGHETSAIFYPFYLWITLGMGFRYGRSYLLRVGGAAAWSASGWSSR